MLFATTGTEKYYYKKRKEKTCLITHSENAFSKSLSNTDSCINKFKLLMWPVHRGGRFQYATFKNTLI